MKRTSKPTNTNRRQFLSIFSQSLLGLSLASSTCNAFSIFGYQIGDEPNETNSEKPLLRMQLPWINDCEFIGYFVAIHKGFYKEEGINFEYLPGGPEIVADSVLLAKRAEIALTTPDVTINAILKQNAPFKIIGAQYQKSPLGIVSLEKNGIREPKDLIGKTLAAPPANHLTVQAFLTINKIPKDAVRVVPYQYDPTPLLSGEVDATLDFITNVPYTIKERGAKPSSFLLYDHGFQIFNDTVVVREETLEKHRDLLAAWLRASRRGWEENFINPAAYPPQFADSYFKGTGRTIENEIFFNRAQQPLIQANTGIFSMTEASIAANIKSLQAVGIEARRDMFVTDLL